VFATDAKRRGADKTTAEAGIDSNTHLLMPAAIPTVLSVGRSPPVTVVAADSQPSRAGIIGNASLRVSDRCYLTADALPKIPTRDGSDRRANDRLIIPSDGAGMNRCDSIYSRSFA